MAFLDDSIDDHQRSLFTGGRTSLDVLQLTSFYAYAKTPEKAAAIREKVEDWGFRYDHAAPDCIITFGGDGMLLQAERERPGIPKLPVRDSLICYKCQDQSLDEMLALIQAGKVGIVSLPKLAAIHPGGRLLAVNDIVVRNEHPTQAIRFALWVDGDRCHDNLIGDGIVAATPFGSTGYYRSITRKCFSEGIGIAFNNITEPHPPLHLPKTAKVVLELTRGCAQLAADNHPEVYRLAVGDRLQLHQAASAAYLLVSREPVAEALS